jgi:hypothetical protein
MNMVLYYCGKKIMLNLILSLAMSYLFLHRKYTTHMLLERLFVIRRINPIPQPMVSEDRLLNRSNSTSGVTSHETIAPKN